MKTDLPFWVLGDEGPLMGTFDSLDSAEAFAKRKSEEGRGIKTLVRGPGAWHSFLRGKIFSRFRFTRQGDFVELFNDGSLIVFDSDDIAKDKQFISSCDL